RNRARADRNDTERGGASERSEDATFGNAEHRALRAFSADMQTGIAVAGDYECIGGIVALDQAPQRQNDAFDVSLGLDAERAFGKGRTHNLRSIVKSQRL